MLLVPLVISLGQFVTSALAEDTCCVTFYQKQPMVVFPYHSYTYPYRQALQGFSYCQSAGPLFVPIRRDSIGEF